ncbi:MAG: sigma-54 dependent transcriptional regulator [Acidobacteriota bacterium]
MIDVLIVDDDLLFGDAASTYLERDGLRVVTCGSLAEARQHLHPVPKLLLLDHRLPDGTGLDLLDDLGDDARQHCRVFVVTAHAALDNAVESLRRGIDDYLLKPVDLELLRHAVLRGLDTLRLERVAAADRRRRAEEAAARPLHGSGLASVRATIERVSERVNPVLITGETGTGKSLVATALHEAGRAGGPFVKINCATLPASLIEAELFGVDKGAFTGASASRPGLFELADGGSLFLDEIGELELPMQAKLLTVLDDREARRIGGRQPVRFDIRVIAATNRDLQHEVDERRFRADLLFRLNVVTIEVPPLRERRTDLPLLSRSILDRLGAPNIELAADELRILADYDWPGNVRELRNTLERALLLQEPPLRPSALLTATAPTPRLAPIESETPDLRPLSEVEREHILRVLEACDGHRQRAADMLGIGIATLQRRLRAYRAD